MIFRSCPASRTYLKTVRICRHLLPPACAAAISLYVNTTQASSALIPGYFLGQATAVEAQGQLGPVGLSIGQASSEACPCRGTNGHRLSDTVSSASIGPAGSILAAGVSTSTAYGLKTATTATTEQTTTIAHANLLNGLITADAIKAVASVDVTTTGMTPSASGSRFTNLVIAGKKIPAAIAANTIVALPGLGSVTVNFVNAVSYGAQAAGVEVEMLRIQVSEANQAGLPVGTLLVVGEAFAGYDRSEPKATLGGYAQTLAVTANAGELLQEAASAGALTGIPSCMGTGSGTVTASVTNLSATGLLSVSSGTTTAFGGPVGSGTEAKTTSSVSQISLLGGVITAQNIEAAAQETRAHGKSAASTAGSSFGQLFVAGVEVAEDVPANTVISLSGLGYVVVNEQPPAETDSVQVNGLHIVITLANDLGLPVGTEIFLAHAQAKAAAF